MAVLLHGYRLSVYTRVAQLVLIEKAVSFQIVEIDPFDPELAAALSKLTPFGRVPILDHDDTRIYETLAIAQYVNDAFAGPDLVPSNPLAKARMFQVISIVNSYAYWPLVRQVFSHRVLRPLMGEDRDETAITSGLAESIKVLGALDDLCHEGRVLDPDHLTLADLFLVPMVDYFSRAPEGAALLTNCPQLTRWWAAVSQRYSVLQTRPDLATVDPKE